MVQDYITEARKRVVYTDLVMQRRRPKNLNLFRIKLPIMGFASILHRVSGAILILATPLLVYALAVSLRSARDFDALASTLDTWPIKLLLLAVVWSTAHHLFAGIRYLCMDLDIAVTLPAARISAWLVNIAGAVVLVVTAGMMLL